MSIAKKAENSIFTVYEETIWKRFLKAVDDYALISDGDKIAVCISGGKDSMLLAKLMQLYKIERGRNFDLIYLVMDPGYNEANRRKIEENAALLEIPITVFESDIFEIANSQEKSPCYLCARMRRGHLYAKAKELGCNKIALGHHFSDVIETTLLGMFYGSQLQAMMPKLTSTNFEGMELIRPLYRIREEDIISWRDYNSLEFILCACKFTEGYSKGVTSSKREEIKEFIKEAKKSIPGIEDSIFNSLHNVDKSNAIAYKTKGKTIENI